MSAQAHGGNDLALRIDGAEPISADAVAAVSALCDRAEDNDDHGLVVLYVSGVPAASRPDDLTVGLVSKWERVLSRLERLDRLTATVAAGDCGGIALDALLATDVRVALPGTRLLLPIVGGGTWPGMALHRLTQQIGTARIRRAVLLGAPVEAAEARVMSLVDELAADAADAERRLAAVAEKAGALSGTELAVRRRLLFDAAAGTPFEDALGAHLAACDRALRRSAP